MGTDAEGAYVRYTHQGDQQKMWYQVQAPGGGVVFLFFVRILYPSPTGPIEPVVLITLRTTTRTTVTTAVQQQTAKNDAAATVRSSS